MIGDQGESPKNPKMLSSCVDRAMLKVVGVNRLQTYFIILVSESINLKTLEPPFWGY